MSLSAIALYGGLYLMLMGLVLYKTADRSTALGRLLGPASVEAGSVFVLIAVVLFAIGR